MSIIVTAEIISAIFVAVSLISQFSDHDKKRSTKALRVCTILMLLGLCIDAAAYSINGPQYPQAFLWVLNLLAYCVCAITFLAFIHYCYFYITERTELKRWVLLLPTVVTCFNLLTNIILFASGKMVVFDNGFAIGIGSIPAICQLLNIIMLIYIPATAFSKRKAIGAKAVSLLGLYGFAPLIAIVIVLVTGSDFTISLGAVSVVIVASLLQKDEAHKSIMKMNEELEKTNSALHQLTEEQESQLEEIKALNDELEERQAQLEETSAEQGAQLEEIAELNRQLEAKQHYTDTLYHKLMKVQSCGIVAYKVPDHKMLVLNDMARRMYDLPIDYDLENDDLIKHIAKVRYDDPETTLARLHSIKNPGERYSFSFWIQHEDGTDVHVHTTTQLIQMDNGDLVVISSMQDISEITKLYKTTEQEKAANSAKTSFLFNMSHDIRTPMNAIIGYTNLIEKYLDEKEKCKDYLEKVKSSNNFLLSLINNVLEMARIESGKVTLDEKPCRPLAACEEVESVYSELMQNKGIHFTQTADIKTQYVYADAVKVRQVFLNLVSNAYKYTNAGDEVTVAIEELPSGKKDHVLMRATISDTGIGMSEDYLPVLFEEFSREQSVTDTKIEGTGLGMPIVKRLVDLMNGTIEVESELGKGTTFVVTLPFRAAEEPSDQDTAIVEIDPERFVGKRILLAEDNDLNAEIAAEVLTEFGFVIERAEDGGVCVDMLSKAEAGYYDVILMDVQMPHLDGYEATKQIRVFEDKAKADIPILAMTANAFEEDKQNALKAGMNGHLAKPIDVAELMKELAGILG